jgi:hypothetical protein
MKRKTVSRKDAKAQREDAKSFHVAYLGVLPLRLCAFAGDSF